VKRIVVTGLLTVAVGRRGRVRGSGNHDAADGLAHPRPRGSGRRGGYAAGGIVLSRDGMRVIELEAGHRKPALRVLDAATLARDS